MTNDNSTDTPRSTATVEAVQAVVDRVGAYQDGAPDGTVEKELGEGLAETGVELSPADVTRLADAIEANNGTVRVEDVLA